MELLIDLFGYLSIVVHGLTILGQSMALGGVLFLTLLARPLIPRLGRAGRDVAAGVSRVAAWSAIGLLAAETLTVGMQVAVLTETVFVWNGVGRWVVDAIQNRDYPIVQSTILVFALIFLVVNLLVDIGYALLNPKIRYQ